MTNDEIKRLLDRLTPSEIESLAQAAMDTLSKERQDSVILNIVEIDETLDEEQAREDAAADEYLDDPRRGQAEAINRENKYGRK